MSPRAGWRLEALGFGPVYHYVAGKADWLAAGLPTVTAGDRPARVADVMDRDVATCAPNERVVDVVARLNQPGDAICVVVNDARVVQGRLRLDRVDPADARPVEEVMEPGPVTVRADAPLADTIQRMKDRKAASLIISDPDGGLLGVLRPPADNV
jgi:predicted transcriptional regulator